MIYLLSRRFLTGFEVYFDDPSFCHTYLDGKLIFMLRTIIGPVQQGFRLRGSFLLSSCPEAAVVMRWRFLINSACNLDWVISSCILFFEGQKDGIVCKCIAVAQLRGCLMDLSCLGPARGWNRNFASFRILRNSDLVRIRQEFESSLLHQEINRRRCAFLDGSGRLCPGWLVYNEHKSSESYLCHFFLVVISPIAFITLLPNQLDIAVVAAVRNILFQKL